MPTIRREGPRRFFWFDDNSNEGSEPPHVHVQRERALAKFWLDPVALASSSGFSGHELRRLTASVGQHRDEFLEAWHEFFGA